MRTFIFEGKTYRSIRAFCAEKGLSYDRMKKLCANYARAHANPALAAAWMTGVVPFTPQKERKTMRYLREQMRWRISKMNKRHRQKVERLQLVADFI